MPDVPFDHELTPIKLSILSPRQRPSQLNPNKNPNMIIGIDSVPSPKFMRVLSMVQPLSIIDSITWKGGSNLISTATLSTYLIYGIISASSTIDSATSINGNIEILHHQAYTLVFDSKVEISR